MLNGDFKKKAIAELEAAIKEYEKTRSEVTKKATNLYELRNKTAEQVIQPCEKYINTLANSPKEFDKSVSELKIEYAKFIEIERQIKNEEIFANTVNGSVAGSGIAAGAGVALLGPSVAMGIATTFGTASTGVAISSLSGAAATNAALAWLGGGAVVAGGGGMAAGNALLALAGPIGWGIGGATLVGSVLWTQHKNKEIGEKVYQEAAKVKGETAKLNKIKEEVVKLFNLTKQHAEGVVKSLSFLKEQSPSDYRQFNQEQKKELASLINNIQSLSKLLNRKIS